MKFIHLGDLHIGKSLGDFDLIEDQEYILDQITAVAEKEQADAVLIAGDVYDKPIPSEAAVRLFDRFLRGLAGKQIKTFVITGNHDSDERLNFGSSLLRASGIYISAKYEGRPVRETLYDPDGPVHIWLMPFVRASQVQHYYPDEKIRSYDDAVRAVIAHSGIDPEERNVLVAHQFVVGRMPDSLEDTGQPRMAGSESAAVRNVGLVEMISAETFEAFDYVALGHIHSAQPVGRDEVRYAGSPLKYSLSEAGDEKYATVVTLGKKGDLEIRLQPLHPLRDLRHIRGRLGQLLDREHVTAPEDFIYATLTDEDPVDNVMGIFQQVYPNTVRIEYDNSRTGNIRQEDISWDSESRTFDEIISDFYRMMYGCDISGDELAYMKEAAKEAGVIHEAG